MLIIYNAILNALFNFKYILHLASSLTMYPRPVELCRILLTRYLTNSPSKRS